MSFNNDQTTFVPVELPNGKTIKIEVSQTGREDVAFDIMPFEQVTETLEGIIEALKVTLDKVQPDKATVKFGVEIAVESGSLSALLMKGSGKGNLEITIGWG